MASASGAVAATWLPLHDACSDGDTERVRQLLDEGALVDEKDKDGRTALMLASQYGHMEVVRLLLGISAESAGPVASTMFLESLPTRQSGRLAQPDGGAGTPAGRGCHLQGRSAPPSWTTP